MNTQGNLLPSTTPARVATPPTGYVNEFRNSDDNLYYGKKSDGTIELIAGTPSSGTPYGVAIGTDTYTVTLTPDPTPLTTGQQINVKFTNSNTGASTLNPNGDGTVPLTIGGQPLQAGEIISGSVYEIVYDGTNLEITGVANQNGIISKTHSQLTTLKGASQLIRGQYYFDTDDQVYLFAVESNEFSTTAALKVSGTIVNPIVYVFANASLQRRIISRSDNFNNNVESSFTTAITDFVFNNISIENNKVLQESSISGLSTIASNVNYNTLTGQSDLTLNDTHASVNQNRISGSSINIDTTTSGAPFSANQISSSTISAVNISGTFLRNVVEHANVIIDNNAGNITDNKIYGDVTINNTAGNDFTGNLIDFTGTTFLDKPESNRVLTRNTSTFEARGAFALTEADYNAGSGILTIPSTHAYFGVIELNLNDGRVINQVSGASPNLRPIKFVVANGKTVTFHPITILAAIADDEDKVVLESLVDLSLKGYANDSDYLVLSYNGHYNVQIEASVRA